MLNKLRQILDTYDKKTLAVIGAGVLLLLITIYLIFFSGGTISQQSSSPFGSITLEEQRRQENRLNLLKTVPESGAISVLNAYQIVSFEFDAPVATDSIRLEIEPPVRYSLNAQPGAPNIINLKPRSKTPWEDNVEYTITIKYVKAVTGEELFDDIVHVYQNIPPKDFDPSGIY